MFKNVAAKFIVFAFDATTNVPKTGDAANITAYVSKDYGAVTVLADTTATEMDATNAPGYYLFDAAQGETNGDCLLVSAKSSTANIKVIGAPATIYTRPTTGWLAPATAGRTLVVDAAGLADANMVKMGPTGSGTAQTARDVGASVLLSAGSGAGQLDFSAGVVKANLAQILGTALTETAGQIAAAFKQFFNIATPAATMDHGILVDTVTTYTGNTKQTGDAFARIGAAGAGLTSLGDARIGNLDAAVSSRLATAGYTAPDNATIAAISGYVDTEITDIRNRLPAALTGAGNMKVDVLALNGSTGAAAMLAILNGTTVVYSGTVTGAATTTTLIDSGLTQADTDWWKGRIIIFTSVITNQATDIIGFDPATHKLTFTAVTQAPTGATFVII